MRFTPGPGLGGLCIPIDPHDLSWKLRALHYNARFIELASEINTSIPRYWVQQVQNKLNDMGKAVIASLVALAGIAKNTRHEHQCSRALDRLPAYSTTPFLRIAVSIVSKNRHFWLELASIIV